MKYKKQILFSSLITVAFASLANNASADVTKINNNTALNLDGSYLGGVAPTGSDLLLIDSTNMSGATTPSLGDNVSILGISASSTNNLTVGNTAGKTLTIGASGITKSAAGQLVFNNATSLGGNITMATGTGPITFGGGLTLAANQTWALGNGRIFLTSALTTGGNTLGISGTSGSIVDLRNVTIGSEVTIGTLGLVYVNAGTVTINGTNNTNAEFKIFSGTANIASMGNVGGASSIGTSNTASGGVNGAYVQSGNTLNYTGNTFSSNKGFSRGNNGTSTIGVTTSGQTLSMSGNLTTTAVTGGWSLGGAGTRTLSGHIANGTCTTVAKTGLGTLTRSGA
ncbi:MAG: hypothetical protein RLZZ245_761, partial [Verrucomicrobiota bacterium]